MNLFQNLKEKAKSFISGPSSFKIQDKISAKVVTIVGIIPKKSIPRQLADRISKPLGVDSSEEQTDVIEGKKVVSSLGKLTLDLIQVNNNLEKISEIIQEDYKNTKDLNKKETEDYRKRIANRFRIIGGRELKSNKVDVSNLVKNFAGSFFKGVGGAIRALAAFNFIDALMRGDAGAAVGALLGMAGTYIPAIIGGVVGGITSSIFGGIKNLFKGGKPPSVPTATPPPPTKTMGPKKFPGVGKYGKMLALGTSALALGSAFGLGNREEQDQTRLDELTQQQKALVSPDKLVPIPQDDLKRFENLNKKFEKAIDFLLGKQKDQEIEKKSRSSSGGSGGGSPSLPGPTGLTIQDDKQALSELGITQEQFNAYKQGVADVEGARYNQMGGAGSRFAGRYQMGSGEIASAASVMGLPNPTQEEFLNNPELQEKIYMGRTVLMNRTMLRLSPQYRNMSQEQRIQVLAGSQLGEGNLSDYLAGKPVSDSAGVEIQRWINSVKSRISQVNSGSFSPPPVPNLPSPSQPRPVQVPQIRSSPRRQPPPTPQSRISPTIIPVPVMPPERQVPMASTADDIDNIPSFETSYSENFLTMYSKLIYQIV